MKKLLLIIFCLIVQASYGQSKSSKARNHDNPFQIVEASCGQCKFNLKTQKGCDLAVRIKNVAYFVDGSNINSHGDAHSDMGFCNAIRVAKVKGKIVNNRFKASYFELLPQGRRDSTKIN